MNLFRTTNGKLIIMLDASAFKKSACIKALFLITVGGYRSKLNSNAIEFGTAFHLFRAEFRTSGNVLLAISKATEYYTTKRMYVIRDKEYLTAEFLYKVCMKYYELYNNDTFKPIIFKNIPLLEIPFVFPYHSDPDMDILMAGTMDEVGKENMFTSICDCKTSGIAPHKIQSYFDSYDLSPQLMFYRWTLGKHQQAFPGTWPDSIIPKQTHCFIDGVFYAGKDIDNVTLQRSMPILFDERTMVEFDNLVRRKVYDLIFVVQQYLKHGELPIREGILNDACHGTFGDCSFANVCRAPDKESELMVLQNNFIQKQYNPLNFSSDK